MLHILSLLFWLGIIPFCLGLIPANFISVDKRNPGFILLAGYFVMWTVFEVAAIPAVLFIKYDNFRVTSVIFMAACIAGAAAGLWLAIQRLRSQRAYRIDYGADNKELKSDTDVSYANSIKGKVSEHLRRMSWTERIEWILFFALLGFQLYKAAAYASFDGDDAYYVVESLIAQQADVMYRILPYTGRPTDVDIRHALAVFPMWVAYVAVKSDIHATIVSHLVMPLVLIPLSYLVYYEIGILLFRKDREDSGADSVLYKENLPVFMIMMCLFQIFGNVSIYTNETFFLTRTWQGKAMAGSLVIPALFWMFLLIYDDAGRKRDSGTVTANRVNAGLWIVFVCVNMTAGICSSIAVFLICILMAVTALCLAAVERDWRVIVRMAAVCIPNVIYMAVYAAMAYGYLL